MADGTLRPSPFECEATMAILTKAEALMIIRRAYGPDVADSLAGQLPDRFDPDNDADAAFLRSLGLTREGLVDALGGDL